MAPNVAATAPGRASAPATSPAPQVRRPPFTPTEQQLAALTVAFARSEKLPRKNSPACDQPEIKRLAELKISWVHAQTWFRNRRRAVRQQGSGGATGPPATAAAAVDTPRWAMTLPTLSSVLDLARQGTGTQLPAIEGSQSHFSAPQLALLRRLQDTEADMLRRFVDAITKAMLNIYNKAAEVFDPKRGKRKRHVDSFVGRRIGLKEAFERSEPFLRLRSDVLAAAMRLAVPLGILTSPPGTPTCPPSVAMLTFTTQRKERIAQCLFEQLYRSAQHAVISALVLAESTHSSAAATAVAAIKPVLPGTRAQAAIANIGGACVTALMKRNRFSQPRHKRRRDILEGLAPKLSSLSSQQLERMEAHRLVAEERKRRRVEQFSNDARARQLTTATVQKSHSSLALSAGSSPAKPKSQSQVECGPFSKKQVLASATAIAFFTAAAAGVAVPATNHTLMLRVCWDARYLCPYFRGVA